MAKIELSEKFAIADLINNAVSDLTKKYLFDREHGSGHNVIKIHDVQIRMDRLYIHYRTYPTYTDETERILFNGDAVKTRFYDTLFEIWDATANLGDKETYLQFNPAEQIAVLRDFLEHGMTRVFCNCSGFYHQGHWEDMAKLDSTIFPFPGPKGRGIWRAKHAKGLKIPEVRICKHIAAAIHCLLGRDIRTVNSYILKVTWH